MEQSFQKSRPLEKTHAAALSHEAQLARVKAALWRAFPEALSDNDLAERAAPYFRRPDGRAIDPKTVRLWLGGVSLPSAGHLFVLIGMVGAGFFGLPAVASGPRLRVVR